MDIKEMIAASKGPILTSDQHTLLAASVKSFLSVRGVPDEDTPVKVVFVGSNQFNERYMQFLPHGTSQFPELALLFTSHEYHMYRPDMLRMSAVVGCKDGMPVIESHEVYSMEELENRVLMLEVRWNTSNELTVCPLSGASHIPFTGYCPFLEGTSQPIDLALVPARVTYSIAQHETVFEMAGGDKRAATDKPLVRIAVTAGELRATKHAAFLARM